MGFLFATPKRKFAPRISPFLHPGIDPVAPQNRLLQYQRTIGNLNVLRLLRSLEKQQTAAANPAAGAGTHSPASAAQGAFLTPSVRQVIASPGRPLDPVFREDAEQRFGQDFSAVRVHTGAAAARSTEDIGAAAYTHRNHIVFAPGRYRPDSAAGRRILAHEIAHVVQQRRGGRATPSPFRGSTLEHSADHAAAAFAAGRGNIGVRGGSRPGVARLPRSLTQSLLPLQLRDDELQDEINEIRAWLLANPGPSPDRTNLQQALADLEAEALRRPTISTRGTVAHTATIGSGASRGTVEVRTNETISAGSVSAGNFLAISYAGANSANARWLQFVWFEMEAVSPALTGRVSGSIPTTSGTKPFTTNPSTPSWSVDSADQISPFYIYSGGLGIRNPSTQAMFDRPGGTSVAPLFQAALSAVSGATSATFTAHFETYLLINDVVVYKVPWAAATTATVSGTTATIANVAYTVGAAAAAGSLPVNLRTILHRDYTSYKHIR